ncbi:MAG: metal-dependent hydrolase [bacterium]|nr:metal-dependent hydrolase [bacterium]
MLDKAQKSYDELYEVHPLGFAPGLCRRPGGDFPPFFKMILDHRAVLFSGGDSHLASMLLWHFCEAIEHRSSALAVYNHVVGGYWYRIKNTRCLQKHAGSLFEMAIDEPKAQVPDVPHDMYEGHPFASVPRAASEGSAPEPICSFRPSGSRRSTTPSIPGRSLSFSPLGSHRSVDRLHGLVRHPQRRERVFTVADEPVSASGCISHETHELFRQRSGDLHRARQELVLDLPNPPHAEADIDGPTNAIGSIRASAVVDLAREEHHRASVHLHR